MLNPFGKRVLQNLANLSLTIIYDHIIHVLNLKKKMFYMCHIFIYLYILVGHQIERFSSNFVLNPTFLSQSIKY